MRIHIKDLALLERIFGAELFRPSRLRLSELCSNRRFRTTKMMITLH